MAKRAFSLYDIEQFLKEEGAERVSENAVTTLEKELEDTLKELVEEAEVYANYAGRKKMITNSDLAFVSGHNGHNAERMSVLNTVKPRRTRRRRLSNYEISRGFPLPVTARQMP